MEDQWHPSRHLADEIVLKNERGEQEVPNNIYWTSNNIGLWPVADFTGGAGGS
jgi:hypothetical protein